MSLNTVNIVCLLFYGAFLTLVMNGIEKMSAEETSIRIVALIQNCNYMGASKDIPEIGFMDCGGEIKIMKLK